MNHTVYSALQSLKPTSKYSWVGTDYSGLTWISSDTKPTESEINAELSKLTNAEPMKLLRARKRQIKISCVLIGELVLI